MCPPFPNVEPPLTTDEFRSGKQQLDCENCHFAWRLPAYEFRGFTQVSNQMIMSCKTFIEDGDDVVWTQPLPVVEAKLNECLRLHEEYRDQFQKLRLHLGDTQEFSEMIMFGKFDKFADRLRKIVEMLTVMQTYRGLRDAKIEGDLLQFYCTTCICTCICVCNLSNCAAFCQLQLLAFTKSQQFNSGVTVIVKAKMRKAQGLGVLSTKRLHEYLWDL